MARSKLSKAALAAALAGTMLGAEALADSSPGPATIFTAPWCAPQEAEGGAVAPATAPPVLVDGLGTSGITPDTDDPEARRWFDQGVALVWAFDEAEAIRAFQQAQALAPDCAMCFWGEAWARGPTINLQPRTEELPAARAAIERAHALSASLGTREKLLIRAMRHRMGADAFDHASYAAAMQTLALRNPDDDATNVIAADSGMIAADNMTDGSLSQRLLERVLARTPNHSGAIHMYIHLTDWIDRQDLAERHAERLGRIAPAASHLVHMPSHTFYGLGRYRDAAAANVAAIAADASYVARVRPPASAYRTGLLGHNMHFAINSALMRGDGATALSVAEQFRARYLADGGRGYLRLTGSSVSYAQGLHGDPATVLALPEPAPANPIGRALRHYARGEALARRGDAAAIAAEARAIAAIRAGDTAPQLGGELGAALAEIAQKVLEGRAAMLAGDPAAAATAYRAAMDRQLAVLRSADPPMWWYSVRRSLGAAELARGEHRSAREQFAASLEAWPNDPLALYGLSLAEARLGNRAAAARALSRARAGWSGDLTQVPLARL
jgi:hypothetical protein